MHFNVRVKYMEKKKKKKPNKTIINLLIVFSFSIALIFMYTSLMSYLDKIEAKNESESLQELYYDFTSEPINTVEKNNDNDPIESNPVESDQPTPIISEQPINTTEPIPIMLIILSIIYMEMKLYQLQYLWIIEITLLI